MASEHSGEPTGAALSSAALSGIRRLSAVDTVRARISLAVDLGLLEPGEWLPGNAPIAAALDVSEITVRRALVALCHDGVLERRRGRGGGTRVVAEPARSAVRETDAYRAAAEEVHRLIDRRLVLECGIAHLAARAAGEQPLAELERLTALMDRAADWAEFHRLDEEFHRAVAAATGIDTGDYDLVLRDLYRYYLPYPVDYLRGSNREHHELVAALRTRDAATAADVAHRHVTTLHGAMFVGLEAPPG
ncbi:FCD domain-containing protein [Saccharopolyspora gloriosae]|uniref:DNA-binding FadR family transcriptional regulator n=1 Tax=Saccharopolyspora gloriosae TaxID=455344 RepID=A0A840NES6_9PSEU|nr:GntR family transcriptional regulator [Saccharopolyspora gloriosae]MBB5068728.1 DNA-binding FadR family transcriptional regulator [Saccharopolyspora gloriosae]